MREDNTSTTSTSKSYTLKTNFNSTCKYRLPCGICDRTGNYCTEFFNYPYYPTWDDPYFPHYKVTYAEGTAVEPGSIKSETATAK